MEPLETWGPHSGALGGRGRAIGERPSNDLTTRPRPSHRAHGPCQSPACLPSTLSSPPTSIVTSRGVWMTRSPHSLQPVPLTLPIEMSSPHLDTASQPATPCSNLLSYLASKTAVPSSHLCAFDLEAPCSACPTPACPPFLQGLPDTHGPKHPPWRLCIQLSASTSGTGAELWRPLLGPNRPLRVSKNIPEVSPGPYRKKQVWTDKHSPAGPQRWGRGVLPNLSDVANALSQDEPHPHSAFTGCAQM